MIADGLAGEMEQRLNGLYECLIKIIALTRELNFRKRNKKVGEIEHGIYTSSGCGVIEHTLDSVKLYQDEIRHDKDSKNFKIGP